MRTNFLKICIFLFVFVTLSGCRRFEEGPDFSLRSVKQRLEGEWKVTEYIVNGVDSSTQYLYSVGCLWNFSNIKKTKYQYTISLTNCIAQSTDDAPIEMNAYFYSKEKQILVFHFDSSNTNNVYQRHFFANRLLTLGIKRLTVNNMILCALNNDTAYEIVFSK